jgi:hypothetical protein
MKITAPDGEIESCWGVAELGKIADSHAVMNLTVLCSLRLNSVIREGFGEGETGKGGPGEVM